MTAPLQLADGTVTAPALTFSSDPNTGLYHTGTADTMRLVAGGTSALEIKSDTVTALQTALVQDGAVSAPGVAFASDRTTGLYLSAAGAPRLSAAGADAQTWDASGSTVIGNLTVDDGGHSNVLSILNTSPASNAGFSRTLTPFCVPKAAGYIKTDGVGGVTVVSGQNIASVALPGSNNGVTVTLATAMADANFVVVLARSLPSSGTSPYAANIIENQAARTTSEFFINTQSTAFADLNPKTNAIAFSFVVFGAQ